MAFRLVIFPGGPARTVDTLISMGIMDLKVKDRQTSFINVNLPDLAVLNSVQKYYSYYSIFVKLFAETAVDDLWLFLK